MTSSPPDRVAAARPADQPRWPLRALALACVLLALMCLALALAWDRKAREAACYREALAQGETPAIADSDCGG